MDVGWRSSCTCNAAVSVPYGMSLTATEHVCRLKSLVLCAAKALAKTRAQNRHALQQAVILVDSSDSIAVRM